jgi:hypothetical protein
MSTTGDGPRAARPVVSLPSADRDTVPLEGTEQWLGTETPDVPLVAEPGDEPLE